MRMPEGTDANGGDLARHSNGLVDASIQPPPPIINPVGTKMEVTQGHMETHAYYGTHMDTYEHLRTQWHTYEHMTTQDNN